MKAEWGLACAVGELRQGQWSGSVVCVCVCVCVSGFGLVFEVTLAAPNYMELARFYCRIGGDQNLQRITFLPPWQSLGFKFSCEDAA